MKIILAAALLISDPAAESDGYEPAEWLVDGRVISCSPDSLSASGSLVLSLGPDHGHELAVRRVSDNSWYFLVVGQPPEEVPQLMTAEDFAIAKSVEIAASFKSRAWAADAPLEPIFNQRGVYEAYISDTLESEVGGYFCSFNYIGVSPNNSFKPTPLRGTA
jgi:hypothetical protein